MKYGEKKKTLKRKPKTDSVKGSKSVKSHKRESSKIKESEIFDANIRNVKLTAECRKRLRKVKDSLWGNVANAIESGNWFIPVKNHNYAHMKESFENGTKDFFGLNQDVCVESFETDIICYDNR